MTSWNIVPRSKQLEIPGRKRGHQLQPVCFFELSAWLSGPRHELFDGSCCQRLLHHLPGEGHLELAGPTYQRVPVFVFWIQESGHNRLFRLDERSKPGLRVSNRRKKTRLAGHLAFSRISSCWTGQSAVAVRKGLQSRQTNTTQKQTEGAGRQERGKAVSHLTHGPSTPGGLGSTSNPPQTPPQKKKKNTKKRSEPGKTGRPEAGRAMGHLTHGPVLPPSFGRLRSKYSRKTTPQNNKQGGKFGGRRKEGYPRTRPTLPP